MKEVPLSFEKDAKYVLACQLLKKNLIQEALALFKSLSSSYDLVQISSLDPSLALKDVPQLAKLENVLVDGNRWFVVDNGRLYWKETSCRSPQFGNLTGGRVSQNFKYAIIDKTEATRVIDNPCMFLGGDDNYCHWLQIYLPKLLFTEQTFPTIPLLVTKNLKAFQKDSLSMLGIHEERLLYVSEKELIFCKNILLLSDSVWTKTPMMKGLLWLREKFLKFALQNPEPRKIYISREKAVRRHITNEQEVWELFKSYGFEKVLAETLTFQEQIETFSAASHIAGAHGAGLTNVLFAPQSCIVMELADFTNERFQNFEIISYVVGQSHNKFISKKVFAPNDPQLPSSFHDFEVDMAKLKNWLKSLL
jgi:capsular polysaccharide biosynthesis protein